MCDAQQGGGGGGHGTISRPSEDGAVPPRLTLLNLLEDWKLQQPLRKARKSRFSHDSAFRSSISREGPPPGGGPAPPLISAGVPSSTTMATHPDMPPQLPGGSVALGL